MLVHLIFFPDITMTFTFAQLYKMSSDLSVNWGIITSAAGSEFLRDDCGLKDPSRRDLEDFFLQSDFKQLDSTMFVTPEDQYPRIVQVGKCLDISKPVGPEDEEESNENTEEKMKSSRQRGYRGGGGAKRMFRIIVFTVGASQRLELLEIAPLSHLPNEITPGTKLVLKSPLKSVGGYHLLTSRSEVEIVGGRVDRLARSYDMGKQAKESRGQQTVVSGPPKFVSFFDRDKKPKFMGVSKAAPAGSPSAPTDNSQASAGSRSVDVASARADKNLQKLDTDAFAMKQRKERQFDRRSRRRDQDDLIEQYKPPSKSAPQLAAFARIDKCDSIVGAQLLVDAQGEKPSDGPRPVNAPIRGKGKGGKGTENNFSARGRAGKGSKGGKGDGRGKGKGVRPDSSQRSA